MSAKQEQLTGSAAVQMAPVVTDVTPHKYALHFMVCLKGAGFPRAHGPKYMRLRI